MNSCVCVDIDSFSEVITQELRAARKQHKCYECGAIIKTGEQYEYVFAKDDRVFTHKTCSLCLKVRNDYFDCGWYWGMVWESLIEHISEDMTSDELEEDEDWDQWILPPTLRDKHFLISQNQLWLIWNIRSPQNEHE